MSTASMLVRCHVIKKSQISHSNPTRVIHQRVKKKKYEDQMNNGDCTVFMSLNCLRIIKIRYMTKISTFYNFKVYSQY